MNEREQQAIISICILAAYADGSQTDAERAQVQRITDGFKQNPALAASYQDVLVNKLTPAQAAANLQNPESRALAYEMAVCVCHADGPMTADETRFLDKLRAALGLDPNLAGQTHAQTEQLLQAPPVLAPSQPPLGPDELDQRILRTAILTGGLEMLPHSLATMAIIPVQMRMVYHIGQRYGFQMDRQHITEFLAAVGIGLTSHALEGFARKIVGGLTRTVGGRLLGGLAETATRPAFAFATTYALGHVAKRYYADGRHLGMEQLRDVFNSMLTEGRRLQPQYGEQIRQQSRQINPASLLSLVNTSI